MRLPVAVGVAAFLCYATTALTDQQCRFIDKKIEREACYARQDADRTAKAKEAEKEAETKKRVVIVTPPMDESDRAMFRTLHSICRGC